MGQNIGYEQNGKSDFLRPVLVIKKVGNMFFTAAMTTHGKDNNRYCHLLKNPRLHNPKYEKSSYVILSQVRVMDKRRFFENVGFISKSEFMQIKNKLRNLLF